VTNHSTTQTHTDILAERPARQEESTLSIAHLFTHSAVTRGGAVQGLLLAQSLQARGHRVVSFFHAPFRTDGRFFLETFKPFEDFGLEIRRINMKNPASYLSFRQWLQSEDMDVIHAHRNLALLFAYFSAWRLSRAAFVVNRGTTYGFSNPLVRHVYHSGRLVHIVAVSQAVKESLINKEGVDPKKISVVYGGYDEKRFHRNRFETQTRDKLGVSKGAPLIVCVSAIDPRKGLHFLLEAAPMVSQEMRGARFLVAGDIQDRVYYRSLVKERAKRGLDSRVIFVGHRNDIAEILSASDVSINCSTKGEGLTGAMRESLAMEKPVVCTATSGNPELVQDGETGWLVPPGDAAALAGAIVEVLQNPREAKRRARAGRKKVERLCSADTRCRHMESIYRALCNKALS
jgi:glycosyltransferase involved in cell wall biosynthesis